MKIAVTVTVCMQIGMETWKDIHTTKVFEENTTFIEVDTWIKSIDKNASISTAKISVCVD